MKLARFYISLLLCLIVVSQSAYAQSETSSALVGVVMSGRGGNVDGARVTLTHTPTGSNYDYTTGPDGNFRFTGLRPGGPYTLTVNAVGFRNASIEEIQLYLRREDYRRVMLQSEASTDLIELETMTITADARDYLFNPGSMGSATTMDVTDINSTPTVARSISDIVRMDPRLNLFDRDTGAISAGGKSTKYNSFSIDGVVTKDSFGLNENGAPALKQPFSLETLAQVSVESNPYDVSESGFTGANIKAITKSGTNAFKGSIYAFYRNRSMLGDLYDTDYIFTPGTQEPSEFEREVKLPDFTEYTAGFTLGGPIFKNKLFFFASYETAEETQTIVFDRFTPTRSDYFNSDVLNSPNRLQFIPDALDQIIQTSKSLYKFEPGTVDAPSDSSIIDDKYLLKLDWNINRDHRMTFRYNLTEGERPVYDGFGQEASTSFSNHWWARVLENTNFSGELFSNWTEDLSTEVKVAHNKYEATRDNNSDLPQVQIGNIDNLFYYNPDGTPTQIGDIEDKGSVYFGRPSAGHSNELTVDTLQIHTKAVYILKNHTFKVGFQLEEVSNYNLFIPNTRGTWRFDSIEQYKSGVPSNYTLSRPIPGNTGASDWTLQNFGLYLQDDWKITDRITITPGVRIDVPFVSDEPVTARESPDGRSFEEVFGFKNTGTVDGNYVIQPRLGFNIAIDEDRITQVRGGAGIFYGSAPHVWLSSTYTNNGKTVEKFSIIRDTGTNVRFKADGNNPIIPEAREVNNQVDVDFLDPDFKMPTDWKANLAVDRKLPWLDMVLTLEAQFSWVIHDIHFVHQNLNPDIRADGSFNGFLPDGRVRYGQEGVQNVPELYRETGYRHAILLTNTDKGKSQNYTIQIQRKMKDNYAFSFGYTYQDSKSVNDGLTFSAVDNWRSNVAPNPNDEVLGTSRYETRHRFIASASYQFDWNRVSLGRAGKTTFSLIYDGRTGRPFSFLAQAVDGGIDLNSDTIIGNDLLYVPTGIDDPIVSWGDSRSPDLVAANAFMAFVDSTDGLRQYKGQIVPRNTGRAPWIHQFDLKIAHEFQVWKEHEVEFSVSILNVGNLINDQWGKEKRPIGGDAKVIGVSHFGDKRYSRHGKGNENGFYVYKYAPNALLDGNIYETTSLSSRWSILVGLTYRF